MSRMLCATKSLLALNKVFCQVSAVRSVAAATDPIQKLFLDRVREYGKKSSSAKDGLVDGDEAVLKDLKDLLDKVDARFGAAGQDMHQFPTFNYTDIELQYPGSGINIPVSGETSSSKK